MALLFRRPLKWVRVHVAPRPVNLPERFGMATTAMSGSWPSAGAIPASVPRTTISQCWRYRNKPHRLACSRRKTIFIKSEIAWNLRRPESSTMRSVPRNHGMRHRYTRTGQVYSRQKPGSVNTSSTTFMLEIVPKRWCTDMPWVVVATDGWRGRCPSGRVVGHLSALVETDAI